MAEAESTSQEEARVPPTPWHRPFLPDPGALWLIFRRRLWIFLGIAALVLGVTTIYTLQKPALYSATATVLIEPRKPQVMKTDPVAPELSSETNVIDTEVQLISSRRLAGRVADVLRLSEHPDFQVSAPPSEGAAEPGTHPLAMALLSHVTVRRSGLTYLVDITAVSADGKLSADIANEFARQYIAQQSESKNLTAEEARAFLTGRVEELRADAVAADAALQRYKIANSLMSAEGATMAEQEVSTLNQEIAKARAELAQKSGQLSAARAQVARGGGGADVAAALQSGTVGELRRKEAEVSGRLAEISARYADMHPEVRKTRDELNDTREQLQREINRVLSSLESDVQAARSRLASLESSQSQARGSLVSNNSAQVGFLELERKAEAARTIYTAFLNRSQQMVSQEGMLRPDARIESLARVPRTPFSPNYLLTGLFGFIGATLAGLGGIGAAEYLDRRLRTKADVEQRLRVRYAGAIPDLKSTVSGARIKEPPQDYLISHSMSSFAEAFRSLRRMALPGTGKGPRTLAITSPLPREGKSITSICLARSLALSGTPTVLVDCDARRRAVSEILLPADWDGMGRFLAGSSNLEQALFQDTKTSLQILGSNLPPAHGHDLFSEKQLDDTISALKSRFEVVIFDTAPVLGIAETRAIAAAADSVILLGRWRSTSLKAADTAIELLVNSGAKLKGMVLTLVDVRKYASTGQEDVYSYHSKFAGYYAD